MQNAIVKTISEKVLMDLKHTPDIKGCQIFIYFSKVLSFNEIHMCIRSEERVSKV